MQQADSVILVGRGPSAYTFDWSSINGAPVMAVSSGIFALPETVMPAHFVTLDGPKWFMTDLFPRAEIAWQLDEKARHWPFWREPGIIKHISHFRNRCGRFIRVPPDLLDYIPEKHRDLAREVFWKNAHEMGFQPAWGDFPNRKAWSVYTEQGLEFTGGKPLGLDGFRNSVVFAVQVASQIGFRKLYFIGIDFLDTYKGPRELFQKWYPIARDQGIEWINLSPISAFADFLPTMESIAHDAQRENAEECRLEVCQGADGSGRG